MAIFIATTVAGEDVSQPTKMPSSVSAGFGFYPIRLYDLSPEKGLFSADFYFWVSLPTNTFSYKDPPKFEAANGEKLECEAVEYSPVEGDGTQTYWYRCRSRFYHGFNFALYPFDRQTLAIKIESPEKPQAELHFEVMPASHLLPPNAGEIQRPLSTLPEVNGWITSWVKIYTDGHCYSTDWGFPSRQDLSTYSQAVLEIRLRHRWGIPLLALLGPNILSALLGALVAGSKQEGSGRMQALLGILAATAAQHYAFMTNAPGISILRFAQVYFLITYAVLALCVWFILTREGALPSRYVWRWFGGHLAFTLAALGIQITVAMALA